MVSCAEDLGPPRPGHGEGRGLPAVARPRARGRVAGTSAHGQPGAVMAGPRVRRQGEHPTHGAARRCNAARGSRERGECDSERGPTKGVGRTSGVVWPGSGLGSRLVLQGLGKAMGEQMAGLAQRHDLPALRAPGLAIGQPVGRQGVVAGAGAAAGQDVTSSRWKCRAHSGRPSGANPASAPPQPVTEHAGSP